MCDNVDCQDINQDHQSFTQSFTIVLSDEFGNDICDWCMDCIMRDSDMVLGIVMPIDFIIN